MTLDEARVDLRPVQTVHKGEYFSTKTPVKVRPNDKLYRMVPVVRNGRTAQHE